LAGARGGVGALRHLSRRRALRFIGVVVCAAWLVAVVNLLTVDERVEGSLSDALPGHARRVDCRKLVKGDWACDVQRVRYLLVVRGRCWVAVAARSAAGFPARRAGCLPLAGWSGR
jgi:hypothetical protein